MAAEQDSLAQLVNKRITHHEHFPIQGVLFHDGLWNLPERVLGFSVLTIGAAEMGRALERAAPG